MTTPRISFVGADPTTSNMGVSALFATMVAGVHRRFPEAEIFVFDTLLGSRDRKLRLDGGSATRNSHSINCASWTWIYG